MAECKPSPSSEALDVVLDEDGPEAKAICAAVHFTLLYAYRAGRRKPSVEKAALLEELSNGRVPANGWRTFDERRSA